MSLLQIKKESDVKITIEEFLSKADSFDSVMLVAINKDGTQFMKCSTMNQYEKSFLLQFIQSSIFWWFRDLETN